ncbi:MAG: hypothetical protein N2314_05990 [Brevinematales bacterium]|nr:hypothetical protein [Brevinematales bacterium]
MRYITLPHSSSEKKHALDQVVWSSRVRFARNIEGRTFPWRMSEREAFELDEALTDLLQKLFPDVVFLHTEGLDSEELLRWYARRVISQNFVKQGRTFGFSPDGSWTVMLLEDDHIRLQSCEMGYRVPQMMERLVPLLRTMEKHIDFAFDEEKGYLTASLLNVGTGLRLSAILNLWGLVSQKKIQSLIEYANQMSYMVVNFVHEESASPLFYLFNYYSLGLSEQEMVDEFQRFVQQVVTMELAVRQRIFSDEEESRLCYMELSEVREFDALSYEDMVYYLALVDVLAQQNILDLPQQEEIRKLIFAYSDEAIAYEYQLDQQEGNHLRWREVNTWLRRIHLKLRSKRSSGALV